MEVLNRFLKNLFAGRVFEKSEIFKDMSLKLNPELEQQR